MSIETVKVEMEVPKNLKEVIDVVDLLVGHFMDKKSVTELTMYIPQIMAAFDGYDQLDDEAKSQFRDEGAAYLVQKIMARLLPVDVTAGDVAP